MTKDKLVGERLDDILRDYYDPYSGGLDNKDIRSIIKATLALFKSIMPEEKKDTVDHRTESWHSQYGWNAYRTELLKRLDEK